MDNLILLCADARLEHLYLLKDFIEASGIEVQIMEKADSVFPSVGESELYVKKEDLETAQKLMEEFSGSK